ncbi:ATP synthase F1 subunit gamma [Mycoplasmopsis cricetuli]|uniref:ATP synthase F1 subunit gamma n=1 Tax=Mycoplasmopsis cricetuli TaxID=171283 RepID=UPI00046EF1C8|nr:ATP synthase F1 subunit gamma [Mycoplasmopsis cricetuli]
MSNLNTIKNRIGVVSNTKKITKAMQLVATAKLQRARKEIESIRNYRKLLEETFDELINQTSADEFASAFTLNESVKRKLYIVITSDIGLCGSYNSNIYAQMDRNISQDDLVIFVGSKGYLNSHLFVNKKNIVDKYFLAQDKFSYEISEALTKHAMNLYFDQKISSINLIFTEFINNINQEAKTLQLFPFVNLSQNSKKNNNIDFLPNAETILKNSIPLYISSMIYSLGNLSKISEMASRRNAMENATDNAEELIVNLNLEFNRKRQSLITQEITEIVSGADATK